MRLPELRQMRCFREVARAEHFGMAARALGISQSAFTEHIQRLEETLGTRLLERGRKGVRLTAAGAAFLVETEAVLRQVEAAVLAARGSTTANAPRLHVGYSAVALGTPITGAIRRLRDEIPDLDLRMFERGGIDTEKALFEEELDCMVVAFPSEDERIRTTVVGEMTMKACLPRGHRLCARQFLEFSDLDDEALIFAEDYPNRRFHDAFFSACAKAGAKPRVVHRATHLMATLTLVASGLGIGLAPSPVVLSPHIDIEFRPLGSPPFSVATALAWRIDNHNPVVDALIALARNHSSAAA